MNKQVSNLESVASDMATSVVPNRVFFIAEIGINHNGDMNIVRKLIDAAKDADCDAVKFQKRTLDEVMMGRISVMEQQNYLQAYNFVKNWMPKKNDF